MQPSTNRIMLAGVLCTLRLVASAQGQATASFQGLGFLPDRADASTAHAISGDGRVVVGWSISYGAGFDSSPFRWTAETGMQGLYLDADTYSDSYAWGVSHDGSVIVGAAIVVSPLGSLEAVRWIDDGQTSEGLGSFDPDLLRSSAMAMTADGTIVGWSQDTQDGLQSYPFHWNSSGGMIAILDPPPPTDARTDHIWVQDVSLDGTVMVAKIGGYVGPNNFSYYPARWTESEGWALLSDLEGAVFATNEDGTVLAGYSVVDSVSFAAMWDKEVGEWTRIDPFATSASDVTADGSIIVGGGGEFCGDFAFIWDAEHGSRDLKLILENEHGLDLAGWSLFRANAISDDGLTIVGTGCNPQGDSEAWIAQLPDPCPADLDGDGSVSLADLLILLAAWSTNPGGPPDFDGDGVVNVPDLLTLLAAWGACS